MMPMHKNSHAADDTIDLEPIQVKSRRSLELKENIPASITVIREEEIKKQKHFQVEDLLRGELGLDVVQNGPLGGRASVFMRGGGSASTLVLVDGIQVNSNTSGGFNFANLTAENIQQIEILRGPQSTLWGADAVGGVINIITKRGEGPPKHSFAFEGGSFATFRETLQSSGALKKFDYSVSLSRTDSNGFSSASEDRGNAENDGYENTSVSTRLGYEFTEDGRVELIGRYIRSITQFDAFSFATGLPTDGNNGNKANAYYFAAPIKKTFAGWWTVTFKPNIAYEDTFSFDPTFSNTHIINRTYTGDLQNNLQFGKNYSVTFGGEYQVQNGVNQESSLESTIYNQGYFLQGVAHLLDRLTVTGGFRHDVNSKFEDKTTYRFEGGYRLAEYGTRLRAAYATGFRAPTINDLFFPGFGNPDLKPEEVKTWEVGVDQTLYDGRVKIGVTYFDSDFTNLIQFDSVTNAVLNVGEATSRGLETEIKYRVTGDLDLALKHTWNETFDENDAPLRRRAKHKFTASVHHTWRDKLESLVSLYAKSGIRDGRFNTDGFVTLRAVLNYQLTKQLKLTARGENLLDEDYEEIPGFGTAGVSGYAGFVFNFN